TTDQAFKAYKTGQHFRPIVFLFQPLTSAGYSVLISGRIVYIDEHQFSFIRRSIVFHGQA
ncbi:MAG: hypothetical protein ACYCZO_12540, partial [Daejeonella sp.]